MSETNLPKEVILEMPVSELSMSDGKLKLLDRFGISTIGQLAGKAEEDLLNIRNFGALGVEEAKNALAEIGLKLRDSNNEV